MAQPRASTSRFSLDDWDLVAPLSSNELASVQRISQANARKPVPTHVRGPSSATLTAPAASHR